ncbi:hypothetical protein HPT25_21280 [Bacillus sp. BRMEA1]|uniref:hypothetical protein n=1 Tax=Neobacillus endophyticus TaxID=2738405 RepID=UPI0015638D55|nr:hypothetical protein [Neobacillus endophyticus]NRD79873.1 hypothetical protein [Neobacillus endophyticus]
MRLNKIKAVFATLLFLTTLFIKWFLIYLGMNKRRKVCDKGILASLVVLGVATLRYLEQREKRLYLQLKIERAKQKKKKKKNSQRRKR